ncbi:MFS transporter [Chloroflexota bacterium]
MQQANKLPKFRWAILLIVWMSLLVAFMARLGIGPLAPFLKESLDISNAQVGLLVTAAGITYVPTIMFSGWLVDWIGVRWVLVSGTLIGGLCIMAIFFVPYYNAMLIIMALSGLGFGCIMPSANKALLLWFPARERATAMGLNQSAVNVSGIIGASLLPVASLSLGWRYGFLFMGLGALVICLCCGLVYRNPPNVDALKATGSVPGGHSAKASSMRLALELFKSRDIWMVCLSGFFITVLEFAAILNLVTYLTEELLFGVVAAGGLLAITEGAGAFGKPISGLISDRLLGRRRKIVFLVMGALATVTCLLLAAAGRHLGWFIYPVLIILGAVAIGWGGLYSALVGELAGKESAGKALGFAGGILVLGVMAGPPLFGHIVDISGSFQLAWFAMALCGVLFMVFMSLVREHKRRL